MTNGCMKRCSTSLIIREIQVKTIMKYHLTHITKAMIKKIRNDKCWQETMCLIGGNVESKKRQTCKNRGENSSTSGWGRELGRYCLRVQICNQ